MSNLCPTAGLMLKQACKVLIPLAALLCMGIAGAQQAPDLPPSAGAVSGSVVNAVTGEPIPRALVQLSSDAAYSMLTDAEGKFEFRGVSASLSALTARKPGYFSSDDSRQGHGERSVAQISSDGTPIVIKLTPAAMISGRVASATGEPLENVPIKLTLQRVTNGHKQWEERGSTITDEDGEYRITNLAPGTYYLQAGPMFRTSFSRVSNNSGKGYPLQFYPAGLDISSAAPVALGPGQRVSADWAMTAQPFYQVAGSLAGLPPGRSYDVEFVSRSGQSLSVPVMLDTEKARFHARVPAGSYILRATSQAEEGQALTASQEVMVRANVDDVILALGPAVSIPIHLRTDGSRPPSDGRNEGGAVVVHLIPASPFGSEAWASVNSRRSEGVGELKNLDPGRYAVEITPSTTQYVASANCAGQDLLRGSLEVTRGRMPAIEIVTRGDGGSISGKVLYNGQPSAAAVIVAPDNAPQTAKAIPAAADGSFTAGGLAPGNYSVVALDTATQLEYSDPLVLADYLPAASHVAVSPNTEATVTTNLVLTAK